GCLLMLRGFVMTQLELAHSYWGQNFAVFLTGGDAVLVSEIVPEARVVPDLVFVGLAMACPVSLGPYALVVSSSACSQCVLLHLASTRGSPAREGCNAREFVPGLPAGYTPAE